MVIHMARDALYRKKNYRFYHCFGDEDGMKHLKWCLAYHVCSFCAMSFCAHVWSTVSLVHVKEQGVARAAHPLHRSRWIMYMMKLRLISMKSKIKALQPQFFACPNEVAQKKSWSGNYSVCAFLFLEVGIQDEFMMNPRLNRSVKKRLKRHR